jgi:hypothetical protein
MRRENDRKRIFYQVYFLWILCYTIYAGTGWAVPGNIEKRRFQQAFFSGTAIRGREWEGTVACVLCANFAFALYFERSLL